jgi:hypothetical protein
MDFKYSFKIEIVFKSVNFIQYFSSKDSSHRIIYVRYNVVLHIIRQIMLVYTQKRRNPR